MSGVCALCCALARQRLFKNLPRAVGGRWVCSEDESFDLLFLIPCSGFREIVAVSFAISSSSAFSSTILVKSSSSPFGAGSGISLFCGASFFSASASSLFNLSFLNAASLFIRFNSVSTAAVFFG